MKIDPSSVRLRATIAATLVVAVALGPSRSCWWWCCAAA